MKVRYLKVMADYSSSGLWDHKGYMLESDILPISDEAKALLEEWTLLYEKSQFYLSRDERTKEFDLPAFNALGEVVADRLRQELTGWTVVHFPEVDYGE